MPVYLFCFVHVNLLHELSDNFRCEFRDFGVLAYQRKEVIGVECCFFFCRNGCPQFGYPLLKGMLLRFVVSGHLGKTLIRDFALKVILVKPLDDFIQFADTLCALLQLTLVFTQASIGCHFGFACDHFQKFNLVVFRKSGNSADIIKQGFFDNHVTNLVGTASTLNFAVGGTNEIFFAVFPTASSHLVQFRTAIGTEQHTGEDRHFTHRRDLAPSITNLLHDFKYRFVHNGFVGIFENLPLGRVVVHLLLVFIGLAVSLEPLTRMPMPSYPDEFTAVSYDANVDGSFVLAPYPVTGLYGTLIFLPSLNSYFQQQNSPRSFKVCGMFLTFIFIAPFTYLLRI